MYSTLITENLYLSILHLIPSKWSHFITSLTLAKCSSNDPNVTIIKSLRQEDVLNNPYVPLLVQSDQREI